MFSTPQLAWIVAAAGLALVTTLGAIPLLLRLLITPLMELAAVWKDLRLLEQAHRLAVMDKEIELQRSIHARA